MEKILILFLFPFLLFSVNSIANKEGAVIPHVNASPRLSHTDSLLRVLKTAKEDTNKVNTLNLLSRQYSNTGLYEQAKNYAEQAQSVSEKIDFKIGLGNAISNIGVAYWHQGVYEKALENHLKALKIRTEIGDKQGIAGSYNNIGLVYLNEGNYEKMLANYFKSLKIKEEIGDKNGMANSYNNIGVIYLKQNNYSKALDIYMKSLKIREEIGDKQGTAMSYGNIGLVYFYLNDYKKALDNQLKGLKIKEKIGDQQGMSMSLNNIGNIYINQNDYRMALDIYFRALKINKEIGNPHGMSISYSNIGICYTQLGKFEQAFQYLNKALDVNREIGNKAGLEDVYDALSNLYNKEGDYKKAFKYQKLYADIKDTILSEESSRQLTEMNAKYESEKKDKALIKKDAELLKQKTDAEKQIILRNTFIMGFTLVLVLAFFIFRGYRQKQKANKLLDEKNEKITDSINYAKRIQESILPPLEEIKKYLPKSFVLYQPKDIVSGDFYWFHKSPTPALPEGEGDGLRTRSSSSRKDAGLGGAFLLAAVDCTGHGVPGAFMSMMGYNLLEQVVKKNHIYQPDMILNELSKLIVESLRQTDQLGRANDGMDIALLSLEFARPIEQPLRQGEYRMGEEPLNPNSQLLTKLEYAGAHNSLYLIRNGILNETKADKASIGFSLEKSFRFTNHTIGLEKGDCLYIFSDGFIDQKGGPDNEKFYYEQFRKLLLDIHHLDMEEQQKKLQKVFSEWKGDRDQVDDMLMIGIRV
jgi:tetratricopeptide (TPR) repeat protein